MKRKGTSGSKIDQELPLYGRSSRNSDLSRNERVPAGVQTHWNDFARARIHKSVFVTKPQYASGIINLHHELLDEIAANDSIYVVPKLRLHCLQRKSQ